MIVMSRFLPKMYCKDIFTINYNKLKEEGIKILLFDVDNTITPAREEKFFKETKKLFDKLKKDFKVVLFSNNFEKRIKKFGDYYDVDIFYLSLKPFSFKYRKALRKYNVKRNEVACIGDQLLTDINGANKMKMVSILVTPISEVDEKETWFNRQIEKKIFSNFEKNNKLIKGKYYD